MADEPLNGQTKTNSEKGKITYSQYGFRSAQKSQSQPAGIDGYLDNVYDQFLEEQKLDEQGLKDRISKLKAELQSEKTKKNDANAEISSHKSFKEDKEKQIEELELEKIDIRNGDGEIGDTSSFVIGAFIMIPLNVLVLKAVSKLPQKDLNISDTNFGDIKPIGLELYNNWFIAFELISSVSKILPGKCTIFSSEV